MGLDRSIETRILNKLQPNKAIILLGARRVGKTELLKKLIKNVNEEVMFLNGDDVEVHNLLETRSTNNYIRLLGNCRFLIIDEAQEIPHIGKKMKLMVDTIDGLKIIASGSSAFELNNQIGEPLVGRMYSFELFPLSQIEFSTVENRLQTKSNLEERLIYGGYPELIHLKSNSEKEDYLKEMVHSYLLKDVLTFEGIKKRDTILNLLQKLAYRSGSEISLDALGRELQISKNTVEKYLDLFKKIFIVYDLRGFSRNRDNEITKMRKWYFVDNGIRNALISNFRPLNMREDVGRLWENYLQAERMKKNQYQNINSDGYFWRTHTQQEIDRIEVLDEKIQAFEYKWAKGKTKTPTQFASAYSDADFSVITPQNYLDYIL
jgi:hypothetical protein